MFESLLDTINIEIVKSLSSVVLNDTNADNIEQQNNEDAQAQHETLGTTGVDNHEVEGVMQEDEQARVEKVGRNDPCPCGSGKKYKNCHG